MFFVLETFQASVLVEALDENIVFLRHPHVACLREKQRVFAYCEINARIAPWIWFSVKLSHLHLRHISVLVGRALLASKLVRVIFSYFAKSRSKNNQRAGAQERDGLPIRLSLIKLKVFEFDFHNCSFTWLQNDDHCFELVSAFSSLEYVVADRSILKIYVF